MGSDMSGQGTDAPLASYYEEKKAQRRSEAIRLINEMVEAGITDSTILALDFTHFGNNQEGLEGLQSQLSENYEISIEKADDEYWLLKGTTRPYGITLSADDHLTWVEFMADVAQSYGFVFSTWSLEAPDLKRVFDSGGIDSAS